MCVLVLFQACIELGVRKFNVNTEVRGAYMKALKAPKKDLVDMMEFAKITMQEVIIDKIHMFGSSGKA